MRIPKEHGAWAMLYVPYAVGVLSAGRAALAHVPGLVLLLAAATGLFLGRDSLLAWWRQRDRGHDASADARAARLQLGGAGACAAALVATRPPWPVLLFGVAGALVLGIHVLQMRRREARTVLGETLAILGLTLTAPAADLVGRDTVSARALLLWALCALFFASSIFHVKLRVLAVQPRRAAEQRSMRRASAAYHLLLAAGLGALAASGRLHVFVVVAFLPVVVRAVLALSPPSGRLDLKRAGILEIVYALHFMVFVSLAVHRT